MWWCWTVWDTLFPPGVMLKKFSLKENLSGTNPAKSSVARAIRAAISEQFPALSGTLDEILPKKTPVILAKCANHLTLICVNQEVLFFQIRDGPYFPHLRLLHRYPSMLPHLQVDRGAIKHVLKGSNIMCPGLTSPGARMDIPVPANAVVAVHAEGKVHALAVGVTKLSTDDIRAINKDVGVETIHYLDDGLWRTPKLE